MKKPMFSLEKFEESKIQTLDADSLDYVIGAAHHGQCSNSQDSDSQSENCSNSGDTDDQTAFDMDFDF